MADEYTLADYEAVAPDPLTKGAIKVWRENSSILERLTFKTQNKLSEKFMRYSTLPSASWRNIGESFTQVKVEPDFLEERVYFMGNKIDIPREYAMADSIVNQRAIQTEAYLKAAAIGFDEAFFYNTPLTNEKAIVGIWYRIVNDLASTQSVDGAELDISTNTATTTWKTQLFDLVEDLMSRVDGNPSDKVLFMGHTAYMRFQSAVRNSGLLDTGMDQLGRQFLTYGKGGPAIVDAGYRVDQSTAILTDVELQDGTALTGGADSSIYCVRFGEPYVAGWAQEMPNAKDIGETEDGVNVRTIVRFSPGLYVINPRSMARLYGLVAA